MHKNIFGISFILKCSPLVIKHNYSLSTVYQEKDRIFSCYLALCLKKKRKKEASVKLFDVVYLISVSQFVDFFPSSSYKDLARCYPLCQRSVCSLVGSLYVVGVLEM